MPQGCFFLVIMLGTRYLSLIALLSCTSVISGYELLHDYSGDSFLNGWDFFNNWDNLTLGNVTYLDALKAVEQRLVYTNDAGNTIIRVDNFSTVAVGQTRNSIRITTSELYDFGSLWIIDAIHLPYGCSVWPAFWSKGPNWPYNGEIDIIEAINLDPNNQMALHTTNGCNHTTPPAQLGYNIDNDCGQGSGCTVGEPAPNSYASGFAAVGGGVWATLFDTSGINIWFWSRPDVPASIANSTSTSSMDTSSWGTPTASFPSDSACNISNFFTAQQLIFDITLCGDWAGVPGIYDSQCYNAGPHHDCYLDNVVGNGSNYDNAYFEVAYVRTYTDGVVPSSSTAVPSASRTGGSAQTLGSNAASSPRAGQQGWLFSLLCAMVAGALLLSL